MDQAAERVGGDFFILPSSIHEVLIVPDNGQMGLRDLEDMVKEVNATQVAPEDKLTDSVYHYDSKKSVKAQLSDKKEKSEKTAKPKKIDTKDLGEAIPSFLSLADIFIKVRSVPSFLWFCQLNHLLSVRLYGAS